MTDPAATRTKGMKPIWYFVGILLLVIGLIVVGTAIVGLVSPPPEDHRTVLYELHVGVWWGTIIVIAGVIFLLANRNVRVE